MNIETEYWGMVPYREAWERQTRLFDEVIAERAAQMPCHNRLVFCEHTGQAREGIEYAPG